MDTANTSGGGSVVDSDAVGKMTWYAVLCVLAAGVIASTAASVGALPAPLARRMAYLTTSGSWAWIVAAGAALLALAALTRRNDK